VAECVSVSAEELAEALFPEGKVGVFVFLKVYGDESYDSEIYCCGSFLGWPKDFYYLGLRWEGRLKKDGLKYFRAAECEGLHGQFDPQNPPGYGLSQARARADLVRHDLVEIIQSETIGGISVSVDKKDFNTLVAQNPKARKHFGTDIMIFSYKILIRTTLELLEQDWPEPPRPKAAFVFDKHSNYKEAEQAYDQLESEREVCAKRMLIAAHGDDREYPGLQMADLMAHEARLRTKDDSFPEPATPDRLSLKELKKTHNVYFMGLMRREQLLQELATIPDDSVVDSQHANAKGQTAK